MSEFTKAAQALMDIGRIDLNHDSNIGKAIDGVLASSLILALESKPVLNAVESEPDVLMRVMESAPMNALNSIPVRDQDSKIQITESIQALEGLMNIAIVETGADRGERLSAQGSASHQDIQNATIALGEAAVAIAALQSAMIPVNESGSFPRFMKAYKDAQKPTADTKKIEALLVAAAEATPG